MRRNKRKKLYLTLILAILFWLGWLALVFLYPPLNNFLIFSFFVLLFLALFLTASLIFKNSRRGLFLTLFIISFLLLRLFKLANLLNIIFLAGIFLSLELYFSSPKSRD